MDFEPPSFSLGLDETQVPSFSLGLDDFFSATPAAGVSGRRDDANGGSARAGARSSFATNESSFLADDDGGVDLVEATPKRSLKRLRRGPSKSVFEEKTCSPSTRSVVTDTSCADEIEEFSSEEEQPNRSHSQSYNPRSFSALKPVRTPPVYERREANEEILPSTLHSRVTSKKTSLGSKEVKFQGIENTYASPPSTFSTAGVDWLLAGKASSSSGTEKAKTPLYEFRDNTICIDLDEEYEEQPVSSFPSTDMQIAQLRRERFPHFLSVDDLEQGNSGEPVYIDYRGQFGRNSARAKFSGPAGSKDFDAVQTQPQARSKTTRGNKRKNGNSNARVLQENVSTGTKGYWLTSGGSKVYVTAEGQRLMGKEGYKRYMKENGKSGKPRRKAGRKSRKKN
ncbi:uncharacterized protein LOC112347237 [Selaginella moellendorffii]|uniref:uncharacterized protein LOC112347237 n=1 Tax=Selaginella moellendorffii TaxID=88036 RepID=UPI000D1C3273|nr:uncharacterized protein LOC112347237 [Selaginella moellendorffii]XP_024533579.1 uncharacterized protein LOC112347237 [Selaginella moellendorffii]|eukprot:XP_024533571.1 uncharacterized protein LOC112347237 [Selaginella moellendorffii]